MLHPPAFSLFPPVTGACNWYGGGDGGSDFTVLELPRTGRAVCGNKPAECIRPGLSEGEGSIDTGSRIATDLIVAGSLTVTDAIGSGSPSVTDAISSGSPSQSLMRSLLPVHRCDRCFRFVISHRCRVAFRKKRVFGRGWLLFTCNKSGAIYISIWDSFRENCPTVKML